MMSATGRYRDSLTVRFGSIVRALAAKLVTREQAQQLKKLSPEDRDKFLDVASREIMRLICERHREASPASAKTGNLSRS